MTVVSSGWSTANSDALCRNPRLALQEALAQVRQPDDAYNERKARDAVDSAPLSVDAAHMRRQKPPSSAPVDSSASSVVVPCTCKPTALHDMHYATPGAKLAILRPSA